MSLRSMNAVREAVSVEHLREALDYDPATGELRWKARPVEHFQSGDGNPDTLMARWNGKFAGRPALTCRDPRGYAKGMLNRRMIWAHRAAIAIVTGRWPEGEVDHINRDKSDNRLCNLRVVSHSENRMNTEDAIAAARRRSEAAQRAAQRPIPGLRRQSLTTWSARGKVSGTERHLGSFKCFGKALQARRAAV